MRRYCTISVLLLIVGCSFCGRAVRIEKEPVEIASSKNSKFEIRNSKFRRPEEPKPEDELTSKQKDAKPQKPSAAEQKAARAEEELIQEIAGLIIEETMTKIGYEFYEQFFLQWKAPQVGLKHYNILIAERASPTWGSLVEVNVGETTVWSGVLRPRSEEIEEAAKQAIEAAKEYLNNYEKYQLQTDDMVGSGI